MLTADLVRVNARGKSVRPQFIDPERRDLTELAEAMLATWSTAAEEGWTRGELLDGLKDLQTGARSVKTAKGLAKLLLDRTTFDVEAELAPADFRAEVFARSVEVGPLALEAGPLERPTADDVLTEVGAAHGLSLPEARRLLYADLPQAQVITEVRPLKRPAALLHRYNVALVQAVLVRATEVTVRLHKPTVGRMRQLLRHVKFQQLMHRAWRDEQGDLHLVLDGPSSMFRQSTRYGLQLASWFPALLLQPGRWSLKAEVKWGKARRDKRLSLDQTQGLVSHYRDTGAGSTRIATWFQERWEAKDTGDWALSTDTTPIELGGRGVMLPDFSFTDGERTAHLEILGFWRRDYLERRVEALLRHGPGNLVLAVSRQLRASKDKLADGDFPGELIEFAKVVPAGKVLDAVQRVAR